MFVPLAALQDRGHFAAATTEIFGPVTVVTQYGDADVADVLAVCERMDAHLTAAVVSNDTAFTQHVLGRTVNGTTYAGLRARTTGAGGSVGERGRTWGVALSSAFRRHGVTGCQCVGYIRAGMNLARSAW